MPHLDLWLRKTFLAFLRTPNPPASPLHQWRTRDNPHTHLLTLISIRSLPCLPFPDDRRIDLWGFLEKGWRTESLTLRLRVKSPTAILTLGMVHSVPFFNDFRLTPY